MNTGSRCRGLVLHNSNAGKNAIRIIASMATTWGLLFGWNDANGGRNKVNKTIFAIAIKLDSVIYPFEHAGHYTPQIIARVEYQVVCDWNEVNIVPRMTVSM